MTREIVELLKDLGNAVSEKRLMAGKIPIVRQISWPMAIPQGIAMAACIVIVHAVRRSEDVLPSVVLGGAIYLVYSIGSRLLLESSHRKGIRLIKRGLFREAIPHFEKSLEFFTRHDWIDRFRCLTMMTPSAISCREMALVNIAFCHTQLGDAERAKQQYLKALQLFPDSMIARISLQVIATFEKSGTAGSPEPPTSATSSGESSP